MTIFRVWFEAASSGGDFVSVYWERARGGRKVSELLCMTDSPSKAGRIVLAMRAMMRLDPRPPRPKIIGFRSVWSASQHKWQLVRSKAKAKKTSKKTTKKMVKRARDSARHGRLSSGSSGSLRDTDWYDKDARFRGPRGDTW
jgi:hypothetical protein